MAAVDSDDDALGAPMFLPAPAFAPPSRHVAGLPLPAEVRSHLLPYKPGRMSIDPAAIPVSIQVDWSDGELDDDDYPVIGGAVADDDDLDMNLQRILKQHGQLNEVTPRVLELNPKHALISGLAESAAKSALDVALKDAAYLLLDQARIMEGEALPDPTAYAKRMADVMAMAYRK